MIRACVNHHNNFVIDLYKIHPNVSVNIVLFHTRYKNIFGECGLMIEVPTDLYEHFNNIIVLYFCECPPPPAIV